MLDRQTLSKLSKYRSQKRPVVSLYLAVDRDAPADKHMIHMKNMMGEVEKRRDEMSTEQWQAVQRDMERARAWVREHDVRGGKSVAIFACGADLWEAFSIPYPLPTDLTLSDRPRLRPLFRLLQRFEHYLAILSDARDARVFLVTPEETREIAQVEDDTPGRHDQGGWSQARFQRHQDKKVEEHLAHAADLAFRLFQRRGFDGVVLMGTEDRTSLLEEQLHPYLSQRVLDRVPMEMEANARTVGETALRIARAARRDRQSELLDAWEDALGGGPGVAGLRDTLQAAQQGQLMTLFVSENLHAEGGKCQQCGALTEHSEGTCDYCGGAIRHFDDITEALTAAALDQGAELLFLASDGDAKRLEEHGGVGALLRYATT
ncbi:MAG: Vms1/Ankzf1 family peptidyl-tRNA hydrolase [Ardenticatenaceae bacterium]